MPRGFTLVELLIYIFLVGLVMGTLGLFVSNLLQARAKTYASSDLIITSQVI
jgi:type II secretory pathway pseudopilin PulG